MRTFAPAAATGAATTADGPSPAWGIRRAARLAFPTPAALAGDPVHAQRLRRYLADLLRPYGRELDPDALGPDAVSCDGQSYGEMAETLIDAIVPAGESVDLLVLAHSIPDITPGRATTTYLSHVCPGTPMAFAVSDQGAAGAFTALRLVDAYARSGGLRRALLLVVEQDSLPYHPGVPVPEVAGSRGVALLFGEPLPGERAARISRVGTHLLPTDSPGEARAAELALLGGGPEPVTAVLGGVPVAGAAHALPADLRFADAGQPGTGVWWELAGELAGPSTGPRRLLLADHDAGLHHLSLATVDLDGADGVSR
ncbi:hypothetical protein [Kitasatospora sp. NPDC057223]|uniref:hypothetical protein n=1 Tax=Kitasatospora sp. NPDC057223 TaxID=3346055 RepID=UPI0036303D8C